MLPFVPGDQADKSHGIGGIDRVIQNTVTGDDEVIFYPLGVGQDFFNLLHNLVGLLKWGGFWRWGIDEKITHVLSRNETRWKDFHDENHQHGYHYQEQYGFERFVKEIID